MAPPSRPSHLGELERAVMEYLWSRGDVWSTVREVHAGLSRPRDIAYTTVMTVLSRLDKKSLVDAERNGRAFRYRASASRDELTAVLMRDALDEFGGADRRNALIYFVDRASAEDLQALRQALDELESG